MQMLTKFESKSSKVKSIAFHSKLPWILVGLQSATIQWWEIRMGTLIDRFEEHDGPVRGLDFHPSQPLFVSGGDDYKIKVWNYKTRRCLFTLNGHLDYVRTVFFHHEYPWILSASDDQTIRIWNWQSRACIAILTGHNHYVMCAQFHPKDDLIVSASLDQTVRVWDISGLRKKHSAPSNMTFEDQMNRTGASQSDIFGNTDAVVKYVLEGHDRGVNWVAFHPTLPLIVSGGDDRLVKLWRMSETRAWEYDTCRGHFNNVSACFFHPRLDLVISAGEDRTIRVWDVNKRACLQTFRRESDRFWIVCAHPEINLFAAGHDNGVMVFKLERERPAHVIHQNTVFYINKEKQLLQYDMSRDSEPVPLLTLQRAGNAWNNPRALSYNPAERALLVTTAAEGGYYDLISLPRDKSGALEASDAKRGNGNAAVFVARNRFAVFTKSTQTIEVRDLSNASTRSFKSPINTSEIYYGGVGMLLICGQTTVMMYDVQQKKKVSEASIGGVKYAVWANDGNLIALLSKHTIHIVTKTLDQVCSIHETIRIKSVAWDDSGVLLYSTLNHIKYTLMSGDNGIIRTLEHPVYLLKVKGRNVFALDRDASVRTVSIDPTEYRFKLALEKKNYEEMFHIIKTSNLVGQSIIAYLQKKGFPEIALQFVQDPQTRFDLGIECGNLAVAFEMAKELDLPKLWQILGTEALKQGNHAVVETSYQKLKQFDKLSFLYLTTGDEEKMSRMGKIAEHRGDFSSWFQNSVYTGDVESRVRMLKEADLYPLAYMTAKSNGLTEECDAILEACDVKESDIILPQIGSPPALPKVTGETFKLDVQSNWPIKSGKDNNYEQELIKQVEQTSLQDGEPRVNGYNADLLDDAPTDEASGRIVQGAGEEESGWEMDADFKIEDQEAPAQVIDAGAPGTLESDLWVRNSPVAADHVAGGSFESAMQLLARQIGAINFTPLKPRFLELYEGSRTFLSANEGLAPLPTFLRRSRTTTDPRKLLPAVPGTLAGISSGPLQEAYTLFKANKIEAAISTFRQVLHTIVLITVETPAEMKDVQELIQICREYILGLSIEMERRNLPKTSETQSRNLELAAYFTHAQLQPQHRSIALSSAMRQYYEAKNFSAASTFASRFLDLGGGGKSAEQARKIKAAGDRSPHDAVPVEYDAFADFHICATSFKPIYKGMEYVLCPWTGAYFLPEYKGQVSPICNVAGIGATATGLRLHAS